VTRDEVIAILGLMKVAYPSFYKDLKKDDAENTIGLWCMMFAEENAKIVTEAVKALMCTLKFPPTIADVKEKIALVTQPQRMTEMEAWGKVLAAIQSANYYAQENYDSLPPIIQKIVGSPSQLREWALMESDTVNSVIQSNFMRSFTTKQKQETEKALLPQSTKAMISGISSKYSITDGGN
jgi:hypothetical protein